VDRMISSVCDLRVCVPVCVSVHVLKGKQLELSTPNLIHIIYTLWQHLGKHGPCGQKVKGEGPRDMKSAVGACVHVGMTS